MISYAYQKYTLILNLLENEGYNLVRADRPNNIKRGGVCIYDKDSFSFELLPCFT